MQSFGAIYNEPMDVVVPAAIKQYFDDEHLNDPKLLAALFCKYCNSISETCHPAKNYKPGKCLLLHCPYRKRNDQQHKNCSNWFVCLVCVCRVDMKRVDDHFRQQGHLKKWKQQMEELSTSTELESFSNIDYSDVVSLAARSTAGSFGFSVDPTTVLEEDDQESASAPSDNSVNESIDDQPVSSWLEELFNDTPRAGFSDIMVSFGDQRNMKLFFISEHTKQLGGIQCMISRCFRKAYCLTGRVGERLATEEEAMLHVLNAAQFLSMGQVQRRRQALLTRMLSDSVKEKSLYRATRQLTENEMDKCYGRSNRHTVCNSLPVPDVQNKDGVAHVNPLNLLRCFFAFGQEMEKITIHLSDEGLDDDDDDDSNVPMDVDDTDDLDPDYLVDDDDEFMPSLQIRPERRVVEDDDSSCSDVDDDDQNLGKEDAVLMPRLRPKEKRSVRDDGNNAEDNESCCTADSDETYNDFDDLEHHWDNDEEDGRVSSIPHSKAVQDWITEIKEKYKGSNIDEHALLIWITDWRDGFGANRAKQNRKSTTAWTVSFSTPSGRINSSDNTLLMAVGLKKNPCWYKIDQQFKEDMEQFDNGLTPVWLYHGALKKVVPVFCRRIACMTDKVERADITQSLSCTSNLHRCFGKLIGFVRPKLKAEAIKSHLRRQSEGNNDLNLRRHGWSIDFVEKTTGNAGLLPSCLECRKQNVHQLRTLQFGSLKPCTECADWTIDETTSKLLSFKTPPNYPKSSLPNSPVDPPVGREMDLPSLEYIPFSFDKIKQAAMFAHYNCCAHSTRVNGWTKEVCKQFLRCCGVNQKCQELLYDSARKDFKDGLVDAIDYSPTTQKLGSFEIPAAWNGTLPVERYIEMLMHILCLGNAASNYRLCNIYLNDTKGSSPETFKKTSHELLKCLTKYNLSWLLALPFSGGKKLTTGAWVSENWLAWIRISKVCYAFMAADDAQERRGGNDVVRLVACFTALVAQVLSHAGVNEESVATVTMLVKEYLSCVHELDILVRHQLISGKVGSNIQDDTAERSAPTAEADAGTSAAGAAGAEAAGEKIKEPWWSKSNYVSLLNLAPMMRELGPLVNFWDGGGRGEKYIQLIKPLIARGVREGGKFFVKPLEKSLKVDCLDRIEDVVEELLTKMEEEEDIEIRKASANDDNKSTGSGTSDCSGSVSSTESQEVIIDATIPTTINLVVNSDDEDAGEPEPEEQWTTPMEDAQMSKARVFYIYKSREILTGAMTRRETIAAVVVKDKLGKPLALALHKKTKSRKKYGWLKLSFHDSQGVQKCGLFYSPLTLTRADIPAPKTFKSIQAKVKMAAVATPLRFPLGDSHPDANKCCVLTNWWKERIKGGHYRFPTLDLERYEERMDQESTSHGPSDNH